MRLLYYLAFLLLSCTGEKQVEKVENSPATSDTYDLILENIAVIPGNGEVNFYSDVYIKDGYIVYVKKGMLEGTAPEIIDGSGKFVIPIPTDSSFLTEENIALFLSQGTMPIEILTSATLGAAMERNIIDSIGTVEEGRIADLIILNESPLQDLDKLQNIHMIIKRGEIHREF